MNRLRRGPLPDLTAPVVGPLRRSPWARRWAPVVVLLALAWIVAATWLTGRRFDARVAGAVDAARAQAQSRAALVEDGLRQGLAQLDGVAHVLASTGEVARAVRAAGPAGARADVPQPALRARLEQVPALAAMNAYLATAADRLGADLVYVLDDAGTCVAASNAGRDGSVVGLHLYDNEFLRETREEGSKRQFSVGRSTGIPGLYFASAIRQDGRFLGAVVVKRSTPALAAMVGHEGAFVVDAQGVVILAQDPRLTLRALEGAPVFALDAARRVSRYRTDKLPVLAIAPWGDGEKSLRRIGDDPRPQVLVKRAMARDALDVYVGEPVPELAHIARERLAAAVLLAVAGVGAIAIVAAGLAAWRSRRDVLDALQHAALANQHLSIEIGERQRAEALLRESREYLVVHEARLRALLRSLPEQVWMKDRAGAYLAVNAEFERFQGIQEPDVLGKTDNDLEPPARAARFAAQDVATLAADEALTFHEVDEPAGGGARRQLEVTKTAVRDDRGQVIGVVGIARDTTAFQAAQQALRFSEARFRATFETAGDAIMIIRHACIVDCNRRAAELFGAGEREALLGRPMEGLAPERQPDGADSRVHAARHIADARDGETRTVVWRCRRLDGEEFDAEITLSVFEHDGHRLLQAVLRDVSERMNMIAALAAAKDEAERANRSKSVFLANMSHEIRTPLNAVLGFTQLLMADRTLGEAAQARLRVIHGAGNRLLGLINDVLDLAKIESGGLQVTRAPFDLLQELRELEHLFAAHARAKGLALRSEIALTPPTSVEGDRNKLGQILSNLLGNALKFTERGHIDLHAWREGATVWIEVHDTGPGMSARELDDLFVPFRQGTAGARKGGTGLGLVLSRDMARAMGGDLTVRSAEGAGTQVRVGLPLPPVDAPGGGAGLAPGAQVLDADTPCRALVIEDDPDGREVLVDVLRQAGCTVVEAVDGQDGLERARTGRFDIVFSDIRMPRLTGVELIERLRADPATRALPVVAVSASSLEHERRFYIGHGFQDFIGKPYPFQDVYRALVEHAGVRLHPVEPPGATPVAPAPASARLSSDLRARLRELGAAAADGQLAAVGRLMAAIRPEAIGDEAWRRLGDAAQAYDFQRLETLVHVLLAAPEAAEGAGAA